MSPESKRKSGTLPFWGTLPPVEAQNRPANRPARTNRTGMSLAGMARALADSSRVEARRRIGLCGYTYGRPQKRTYLLVIISR